ncbi:MAG: Gfo/Idh/MocA family oxidoreductase [Limisphaerales bacterium]
MTTKNPARTVVQASQTSRRQFLEQGAKLAAVSALAGVVIPRVHAASDDTIRMALIGCGGRGSGAVANAFEASGGPTKLTAMADLVESKLNGSHQALSAKFGASMDVPPDRRFLGFDAYRHAIDCLRPGDVALLTTHAAFRAPHLEYAIAKGVNVFMEKSFATDPAGIQRILRLGEAAEKKNLKIATGLMCRHSASRQELIRKVREGELGDINFLRAYRLQSGHRMAPSKGEENELIWQIRHPHFALWVATGVFIDNLIHQVDECCWVKDAWPVSAHGLGGRAPDNTDCSQNLDTYSVEYTFADGARALVNGRFAPKCHSDFATFIHGTKRAAQFSGNVHAPTVQIYKDQRTTNDNIAWRPAKEAESPYQAEWSELLRAIRGDQKHNEVRRSALSNLAAIMGRAAVHSGKIITWEEVMASNFKFCPDVDALTEKSAAPVRADAQGRYPVPVPGVWSEV